MRREVGYISSVVPPDPSVYFYHCVQITSFSPQARRNVFVSGGGYKFVRTLYSLVVKSFA